MKTQMKRTTKFGLWFFPTLVVATVAAIFGLRALNTTTHATPPPLFTLTANDGIVRLPYDETFGSPVSDNVRPEDVKKFDRIWEARQDGQTIGVQFAQILPPGTMRVVVDYQMDEEYNGKLPAHPRMQAEGHHLSDDDQMTLSDAWVSLLGKSVVQGCIQSKGRVIRAFAVPPEGQHAALKEYREWQALSPEERRLRCEALCGSAKKEVRDRQNE